MCRYDECSYCYGECCTLGFIFFISMPSVIMMSILVLNVVILIAIILRDIKLSVIRQSVVILSVAAPLRLNFFIYLSEMKSSVSISAFQVHPKAINAQEHSNLNSKTLNYKSNIINHWPRNSY
jgi:hypothetical protein